jgi:hypothetical protein
MSKRFRRRVARGCLPFVLLIAASLGMANTASAAPAHPFLGALTGAETEAGEFVYACGVAVDESGYLYVSSAFTSRINVFSPEHDFVTSITDEEGPCGLAIDSEGNVYVMEPERNSGPQVELFSPASYPPTSTTTYSSSVLLTSEDVGVTLSGLAVNPATDHAYISTISAVGVENKIFEFQSVADGSAQISATAKPAGLVGGYRSLGVYGATGEIYVVADEGSRVIAILNPSATAVLRTIEGSAEHPIAGRGEIAVDQSDGNVVISEIGNRPLGSGTVSEFEPDGTFVSQIGPTFGEGAVFEDGEPSGLAIDNSSGPGAGDILVGSGSEGAVVYEFGALTELFELEVEKSGEGSGTVHGEGIDCGTGCSREVAEGELVELTATADPGSRFVEWTGDCTGSTSCEFEMDGPKAVTAIFEKVSDFTLAVAKTGIGSGTVTSSPAGIDCGSACNAAYEQGQAVTLTPAASAGSEFKGWSGACSGAGSCVVTMSEAKSVSGAFDLLPTKEISTCATTPSLCPPLPGTVSTGPKAIVKKGKAKLDLLCTGSGPCVGSLQLTAKLSQGKKKDVKTVIGRASFSLAPGASASVTVKLTGAGRKALESRSTLPVTVSGAGVQQRSLKLKLSGGK